MSHESSHATARTARLFSIITLATVLCTASLAHAQALDFGANAAPIADSADSGSERFSPVLATGLAVIGTAASWGALYGASQSDSDALWLTGSVGVLLAPSLGHFYTRDYARSIGMVFVRGAGLGVMLAGGAMALDDCGIASECDSTAGTALLYTGAAIGIGATLYSMLDAGFSARRQNAKAESSVYFSAAPMTGPDRSQGMGLVMSGSF